MKKREKTDVTRAAGRLVKELDRVWEGSWDSDDPTRAEREMNAAHDVLEAEYAGRLVEYLAGRSVYQVIGMEWLAAHPTCLDAARKLDLAIESKRTDYKCFDRTTSRDTLESDTEEDRL